MEYLARLGAELKAPRGEALPGLEGWKVSFTAQNYVVFENGDRRAAFATDRPTARALPGRKP